MTVEEVNELFAPAQDSVDAVTDWLMGAGIDSSRISQSVNKQVSVWLYCSFHRFSGKRPWTWSREAWGTHTGLFFPS